MSCSIPTDVWPGHQVHHKNSTRHLQPSLGPFTLSGSDNDGALFVKLLTVWLRLGRPMLAERHGQPGQGYAFLHPSTGRPFNVASFCGFFKQHMFRMTRLNISPMRLRSVHSSPMMAHGYQVTVCCLIHVEHESHL